MKTLVEVSSGIIVGTYSEPIRFNVSGFYVIDVPNQLSIDVNSSSPSTILNAKSNAIKNSSGLSNISSDEFLDISRIDPNLSSRIVCGPKKKIVIQKSGFLMTTAFTMTGSVTKAYLHYYAHRLFRDFSPSNIVNPPPAKILYGFDGVNFSEIDNSQIQVDIMNSVGNIVQAALSLNNQVNYSASSPSVRIRITNNSNDPVSLSNWYLCWLHI
jgi:hypothetical protein